jgi:predicted deacetylase
MPRAEPAVCVVLHDVAPATWPGCERLLAGIDALGNIPVTLLVVPEYHHGEAIDAAPDFIRAIERRIARGDETAMHGLYHLDDGAAAARSPVDWIRRRCYTAGEGEFSALDEPRAQERLERGLARFASLGWTAHGFVAPAWLLSRGARAALTHSPFRYTATRERLYTLPDWQAFGDPGLVWSVRSAWRRMLSVRYNRWLNHRLRHAPLLRLGLHPADAAFADVTRFWIETLRAALESRVPMIKAAWLGVNA